MIAGVKTASHQDLVTTAVIQSAKNESLVRIPDLFNRATTHTDHRAGGSETLNHGLVVTLENALTLLTAESRDAQELPITLETTAVIQKVNQGRLLAVTLGSHPPSRSSGRSRSSRKSPGDRTISLSPHRRHQPRQLRATHHECRRVYSSQV